MGIKDLWQILGPFCERKPLFELQGKTVAIDLSCWICEAQNISDYQVQPRMYLRNLYFRTCYLLLLDVYPVFVLDGKAPKLKYKTIAARNAIQFRGAKPKDDPNTKKCKDRTRFNYTLKQCEEMLRLMGLACVTGNGEAEALCAHLNEDGLVHGCITQDSDCFAYGAKIVFRNFSISQQGVHAASGGSIDVYDIDRLWKNNGIGRNKIIALALLCGSDYNDGVFGVGKDSVVKLFKEVSEEEILDRLRSWRTNVSFYDDLEKKLCDKSLCTNCGHPGKLQSHSRCGCGECGKTKGCNESDYKETQQVIKNEVGMRKKALEDPDFPNEELIGEFLKRKDNVGSLNLKWMKPDMVKFVYFCQKFLQWDEIYTFEKFLPILTRWQLLNTKNTTDGIVLYPDYIKKVRNPKGIPSYEIIWLDKNNTFKDLIPQEQLAEVNVQKLFSTIEPQSLVQNAYPDLVAKFLESKAKPKKQSKRKNKAEQEDKLKKSRKPKTASKAPLENQKSIDSYLKTALMNSMKETNALEKNNGDKDVLDFDVDLSRFGDENDSDLSDIIEDIVSRKPDYVQKHLDDIKLRLNEKNDLNSSNFFVIDCGEEEDVFEKTFNELCRNDSDESKTDQDSKTDEDLKTDEELKSYDDLRTDENLETNEDIIDVENRADEPEDSFIIDYKPLVDRIKAKINSGNVK